MLGGESYPLAKWLIGCLLHSSKNAATRRRRLGAAGVRHGRRREPRGAHALCPRGRGDFSDSNLLAEDWQQHGREVFKRVRRESPATHLKVCAMLVPREMKLEHSGGVKAMTDEQLERTMDILRDAIARREAEANAKLIEGVAEPVPALPPPSR